MPAQAAHGLPSHCPPVPDAPIQRTGIVPPLHCRRARRRCRQDQWGYRASPVRRTAPNHRQSGAAGNGQNPPPLWLGQSRSCPTRSLRFSGTRIIEGSRSYPSLIVHGWQRWAALDRVARAYPKAIMTERNTTLRNGPYIGRSLPRLEDLRLVRGAGRYTDDIVVPGQACATFLRSPHAHARILRIDTSAARARPGVLAVLTGADYVADGLLGAAQGPVPAD